MIDLRNCDNMELMRQYPDKHFDIAIVDPPYGIGADNMQMGSAPNRKSKGNYPSISTAVKVRNRLNGGSGKLKNRILNKSNCSWDIIPDDSYFKELFRVSKNQIIFGSNYFKLPPTRGIFCWDKLQPWENFSQIELGWTSFDKPAKIFRLSNTGGRNQEIKIHPTQKPVALYTWILQNYAKEGDKILDTHLGSGSIAIACYDLKYDLVGCEIDSNYYSDMMKRFEAHAAQVRFDDYL